MGHARRSDRGGQVKPRPSRLLYGLAVGFTYRPATVVQRSCRFKGSEMAQSATATPANRPRVVVVGAGFGGLEAARALADAAAEVVVIDATNHHTFQPLLYQ